MSLIYSEEEYAAIVAPVTEVGSKIDVLTPDGSIYLEGLPVTEGKVTVDAGSTTSRRVLSATIHADTDNPLLAIRPGALWYDKIIVPYRGVRVETSPGVPEMLYRSLGHFMPDSLSRDGFPVGVVSLSGKDKVKAIDAGKFGVATTFTKGRNMLSVVRNVAANSGIPITVEVDPASEAINDIFIGTDFAFGPEDSRWKAVNDICTAYGVEVYFNRDGKLFFRYFQDPATQLPVMSFVVGSRGNVNTYTKVVGDARLYNEVVVVGSGVDPPVVGWAQVTDATNPVNIYKLGRRTYRYESSFIYTQTQANLVAQNMLKTASLEEYNVTISTLAMPLLEAGDVVEFIDPLDTDQDTRFFLHDFDIPLGLGTSTVKANRVLAIN